MILLRLLICLFLITSCQKFESSQTQNKKFNIEVIYGEDNRVDFFDIQDPHWQQLAQSTAVLMDEDQLEWNEEKTHYQIHSTPYGQSFNLCEEEAFREQPSAGFCSGFLIGPDIMITAGHCLRNQFNCEAVRFVFGFHSKTVDSIQTTVPKDSVYQCKTLIHSQANALTGSDYAVIRLDRPVTPWAPLLTRTEDQISAPASFTVIGYPSGLPLKLAHDGLLRANTKEAYFVASLDTYGGNSGSAVFNSETRLVEGILVRGDTDFVYDAKRKCRISNVCKQSECRGEDVTRISEVLKHLTPQDL